MIATRLLDIQQVSLAFGLDWLPVLGDPELACAQARRERISHLVLSGNPAAALGMARGLSSAQACWSAADLLAREYPHGTYAGVVMLDPQTWHVLACHEGVVLARADRSYPQRELADQAIRDLRLAYPRLQYLWRDQPVQDVLRGLARRSVAAPRLLPVKRHRRYWALLAASGLAGFTWWGTAHDWTARGQSSMDAAQAWQQALERTLARAPIHGEAGTQALLDAVYAQPVRLAGWVLQGLQCQASRAVSDWQCRSEYQRQDVMADNRGLLQAAPSAWRLDFPSLDRAHANWTLSVAAQPPDPQALPPTPLVSRNWASALQAVLPAFTTLRVQAPRALPVPAPQDEQGRDLPPPQDFPRLATRAFKVEGPLHSARLLTSLSHAVSWDKAAVAYAPGTRPGLKTSRLILRLEGSLYENRR